MYVEQYTSSDWMHLLLNALEKANLDTSKIIANSGISYSALHNPNALFSEDDLTRIWQSAANLSGNPAIGLAMGMKPNLGELTSPAVMPLLCCENVGEAQKKLFNIKHTIGLSRHLTLEHHEDGNKIILHREGGKIPPNHQGFDAALALFTFATRFGTAEDISPRYVKFKQAEPADVKPYKEFFKCALYFSQDEYAIFYDNNALKTPLIFSSTNLASDKDTSVEKSRESETFSKQVKAYLQSVISNGEPKIQGVADHFRLGTRTVQRRLKKEGWSYFSLLDSTRKELAHILINQPSLSLKQITLELGFTELSSFYRAFKRWFGYSPGEYRKLKED